MIEWGSNPCDDWKWGDMDVDEREPGGMGSCFVAFVSSVMEERVDCNLNPHVECECERE